MRILPLVLLALAMQVQAGEGADEEHAVHVDLNTVIAQGEVTPVDGITSSGQPNEAALNVFAASGYAAVIDMRGADENRGMDDFEGAVAARGMDYIAFPVTSAEHLSLDNAKKLDVILQGIDGPVLLHCGSGNRVGALLALRKSLHGVSDEEAIAYGRDAGMTGLEAAIRKVLEQD